MGPRLKNLGGSELWRLAESRTASGGRVAATRRVVLDSVRRQSKLAIKVSRRGLAVGGGRKGAIRQTPFSLHERGGKGVGGVDARSIATRVERFQRSKVFRANLSPPLETARILLAPESTGRASGRRPSGFEGWSSGKRPSAGVRGARMGRSAERGGPQKGLRAVRTGRRASRDRRTKRNRRGLKSPMRSGACQCSARRGPPSERVKNPRPEGFWKKITRSA